MKKLTAVLFVMITLLVSVSLSEEAGSADASEGSRLIGLAEHTDEAGVLLASCEQKEPGGTEGRFMCSTA